MLKLSNDVVNIIVPKNLHIWWRQVCRRMRDGVDLSIKVEIVLSSMGCENVTSQFLLKFVKGIERISCVDSGRRWVNRVVDALRKGAIINEIEMHWLSSNKHNPFLNDSVRRLNCQPKLVFIMKREKDLVDFNTRASELMMSYSVQIIAVDLEPKAPHTRDQPPFRGKMPELIDFFQKIPFPEASGAVKTLKIRYTLLRST